MTPGKRPTLLDRSPAPGLARPLLGIAVSLCFAGCLLPQDDAVFPDLPPRRNTPLRIVNWSPQDLRTTVLVGASASSGCATTFSVVVEDLDLPDTTQSQWYLDRTSTSPSFNGETSFGGATLRTIKAPTALLAQLGSFVDNQRHLVELFVTDGQFTEVVGEARRAPVVLADGGVLEDRAYVDTKAWFVEVQRCE
jgi:hypothetical protein